jgi:hypothetical protein
MAASASGLPIASAQSLRRCGSPLRLGRIGTDADRNACGAFFGLTLRAARIAPRI